MVREQIPPVAIVHEYLCKLGIDWMSAYEIIGKYSLENIREAVLKMGRNGVNVSQRENYLRSVLENRETEPCD